MQVAKTTLGLIVGCGFGAAVILMLITGQSGEHERVSLPAAPAPMPGFAVGDKLPLPKLDADQALKLGALIEGHTGHYCGSALPVDGWMAADGRIIRVRCSGNYFSATPDPLEWDMLYPPNAVAPIYLRVIP